MAAALGPAGNWTWRVVPWPGGLRTEIVPPSASTRSLRPMMPRAAAGVGAADAIVADREGEGAVAAVDHHGNDRRLRVLGGVGERFGGDVIGGRLNSFRGPRAEIQVEFDRHRGAPGERLERRA